MCAWTRACQPTDERVQALCIWFPPQYSVQGTRPFAYIFIVVSLCAHTQFWHWIGTWLTHTKIQSCSAGWNAHKYMSRMHNTSWIIVCRMDKCSRTHILVFSKILEDFCVCEVCAPYLPSAVSPDIPKPTCSSTLKTYIQTKSQYETTQSKMTLACTHHPQSIISNRFSDSVCIRGGNDCCV